MDRHDLLLPVGIGVEDLCSHLALAIELAVFNTFHGGSGVLPMGYQTKLRSIEYNLRKNPALSNELLCDGVTPQGLANMTTDDMAVKELKGLKEQILAQQDINLTLVKLAGPRIRKTHKGDELVGSDIESDISAKPDDSLFSADNFPTMRGKSVKPSESCPPIAKAVNIGTTVKRGRTESFDIERIWGQIESRAVDVPNEEHSEMEHSCDQPSVNYETSHSPEVMFISDDEDDYCAPLATPSTHALGSSNSSVSQLGMATHILPMTTTRLGRNEILWMGRIEMEGVVSLCTTAMLIGGPEKIASVKWPNLLQEVLTIDGQAKSSTASIFLRNINNDGSYEVLTFAMSPTDRIDEAQYDELYQRVTVKGGYSVVKRHFLTCIRKTYVFFLKADEALPFWFLSIYPTSHVDRDPRTGRLLVVVLVVHSGALKPTDPAPNGAPSERYTRLGQHAEFGNTPPESGQCHQDLLEFFSRR